MTLAILSSLKTVESLQNGLQKQSGVTPLFSMTTDWEQEKIVPVGGTNLVQYNFAKKFEVTVDLNYFRVSLNLLDRSSFSTLFQAIDDTWVHMVLNYIGPDSGQGIRIYYNGVKLDGGNHKYSGGKFASAADGTVTVGRFGNYYSSVAIDELLFYNVKLTDDQIRELYNQGFN